MEIKGYLPTSLIDWPGKTCSVIFLNRCNFRCRYCHNKDLAKGMESQNLPPAFVLSKILQKKKWISGVVITGGEPTLHRDLPELCRDIKYHLNIDIKLDTNGSNPTRLKLLLDQNLVDKISMDIKAPLDDNAIYNKTCQANINVDDIEKSINIIKEANVDHEFRTTICPALLSEEDILKIACELTCICGRVQEYTIQNFRPNNTLDPEFKNIEPYPEEKLRDIRHKILQKYNILKCTVK